MLAETTRRLTLTQAARFLGVHPSTLRRWADSGEIRYLRTPGGHRRFLEEDLRAFLGAREQREHPAESKTFAKSLIIQTRQEMTTESVSGESWHTAFGESDRVARRESGQRLVGLALQYTMRTTGREPILKEARRIGRGYGQDAAQRGLSLVDTVQAFLFFRETLIRTARPGLSTRGQYDAEDVRIHRGLREFLDQVFFAILGAYEQNLKRLLTAEVPK